MASLLKKLSKGSAAHSAQATGKPGKSTGQTVNALHRAPSLSQAPKSGGWSSAASASPTATGPAAAMVSSFSAAVRPTPPAAAAAAAAVARGHGPAVPIPGVPPVMYPTALQQILDCNGGSNEETTRKHQEKHVENWIEWYGGRCECVGRMP